MMQEKIEIIKEKKVWEVPSFSKLSVSKTFAGGGAYENDQGNGNGAAASDV